MKLGQGLFFVFLLALYNGHRGKSKGHSFTINPLGCCDWIPALQTTDFVEIRFSKHILPMDVPNHLPQWTVNPVLSRDSKDPQHVMKIVHINSPTTLGELHPKKRKKIVFTSFLWWDRSDCFLKFHWILLRMLICPYWTFDGWSFVYQHFLLLLVLLQGGTIKSKGGGGTGVGQQIFGLGPDTVSPRGIVTFWS